MKLLLIFCFSLFSLVEVDYVPQEKKESIVMVARPEAKDVFAALIDGKPYPVEASDIQLLEELMASVAIRGKESKECKELKKRYPEQIKNVSGVFVVELKEGVSLPEKFIPKSKN